MDHEVKVSLVFQNDVQYVFCCEQIRVENQILYSICLVGLKANAFAPCAFCEFRNYLCLCIALIETINTQHTIHILRS